MSDRFPRCGTCGRLVFRTLDGYCSPRCAGLAARGYSSRAMPAAALRAPASACDARLVVRGWPQPLPAGVDDLGEIGPAGSGRRLVRVEADDPSEVVAIAAAIDGAEILTLQQLVPGGLAGNADRRSE